MMGTTTSEGVPSASIFRPFGDDGACLAWLWKTLYAPDGVNAICKDCRQLRRFHRVNARRAYACDACGHHTYPTAGTFMENSRLSLVDWFSAAMLFREDEAVPTAEALTLHLGVNYKTALRIKKRLLQARSGSGTDAALLQRLWRDAGGLGASGREGAPDAGRSTKARNTIRAAACRAFATNGLPTTRISDIAGEAGVSAAVVRYYYKTKDDILLAALQWAMEQTFARVDELRATTTSHTQRLRGILEMSMPSEGRLHDEILLWLEVYVRIRSHPELLPACVAISDYWLSTVREAIEDGEKAGAFHPDASSGQLAQWLVALADGLSYRSVVGYTGMNVPHVTDVLLDFAARHLGLTLKDFTE